MDPFAIGAMVLAAATVVVLVSALRNATSIPRDQIMDRVERVSRAGLPAITDDEDERGGDSPIAAVLRFFSKLAKPKEGEDLSRIRVKLTHAGFRSERAVEVFFGAKITLGVTLGGTLLIINSLRTTGIHNIEVWVLVLTAFGFYSPDIWLTQKVDTRQTALTKALPDTLDLLVTCVEAGLSIEAAIARVTDELALSSAVLAQEFRQTLMEIRAGMNRAEAFRRLAERTGIEDLRTLSAMLIQTEMFGTSIARALRIHSSSMRTRRTHRAEEKGATVAVKMLLPLILCILPSLFCILLGPAVIRIARILLPTMGGK